MWPFSLEQESSLCACHNNQRQEIQLIPPQPPDLEGVVQALPCPYPSAATTLPAGQSWFSVLSGDVHPWCGDSWGVDGHPEGR